MSEVRRAATIRGRVQGVSFRWFTRQEADRLGLTGWVRNERDGTVRLEVQGSPEAVDTLLRRVGDGPPHAQVVSVEVEERAPRDDEAGFRIDA